MKASYFIVLLAFTCIFSSCEEDDVEEAKKDLNKGLVGYYTFDNGDANDSSKNKFNGVLINAPEFVSGGSNGSGNALFLNGLKEQFMNIPYNPIKTATSYSISMWVKDFGSGVLLSAISSGHSNYDFPKLIANSDEKLALQTTYGTYTGTDPFTFYYRSLQNGSWHLITVVFQPDEEDYRYIKSLYVDGKLVDSAETRRPDDSNCTKIQIGGNADGKMETFTSSMKVDNIRLYDRALSAVEVEAIYVTEK